MKKFQIALSIILFVSMFFASITPKVEASQTNEQKQVIVVFKDSINQHLINQVHGIVHEKYEIIHGVSMTVPIEFIPILKNDDSVLSVQEDQIVQMESQKIEWGNIKTRVEEAKKEGFTGKGVKIAILDTGVDRTHPDLKIAGGACFLTYCPNSFQDDNGHGTHVAGIIGAQNNSIGIVGVVPDAEIYALKVLDYDGIGLTSKVIEGIEWAIEHDIDIINLSLSSPSPDYALKVILDKAYNEGMLIVSAAGNNGTPSGAENTVEYPAKYASVIGVASLTEANVRHESSATGQEVEISAPGVKIFSTIPKSADHDGYVDGYTWMTGTSMAAPFVTGILAQYKQQYPSKTNVELRNMLAAHAVDLGAPGRDNLYGYGLAQAIPNTTSPTLNIEFMTSNGAVSMKLGELPSDAISYNIYRDGKKIAENETNLAFVDYVLKGTYMYQFSINTSDGQESNLTSPSVIEVSSPYYKDLTNSYWFTPQLIYLTNKSIISGFKDGTMRPNRLVTRAEAVAMVGRAIGLDGTKKRTIFSDVDPESFASGYIQSAYEHDILHGFPDRTFRPNQPVSRAEMAILIANAYHLTETSSLTFTDVTKNVTGYMAINKVAAAKITVGYPNGTFKPYDYMKRADFGVFIARAENEKFR